MAVYFPAEDAFPELLDQLPESSGPMELSQWVQIKVGTLRYRIDALVQQQSLRRNRHFSPRDISGHLLIRYANEVFGFNGWSTCVLDCDSICVSKTETSPESYSAQYKATVKMTLNHGDFILEGLGIGKAHNLPTRHLCINKCRKESVTNATKQCLLHLCSFIIEERR